MNKLNVYSFSVAILLPILAGCGSTGTTQPNKSAQVHTELAGLYYERGQMGIALDEIRQALQADDDYAPAYNMRGLVHMGLREDKQAEADFLKSLRLDKNDSEAHNNYGWFLCQRDREEESIPHFLTALKNPMYQTPGRAYLNAGLCSQKAGNDKDAEEFLKKALLVQPDFPQAMLILAEISYAKGDYPAAKKYFSGFANRNNSMSAEQLWLGVRIERKVGDRDTATSYGLQMRKRYPDAPETRMYIRVE